MVCKVTPKNSTSTQRVGNNSPDNNAENSADYETALHLAGYGRFSRSALGACATAFFTTGVQNCLMAYVLPAARCELHLSTYQAGLVNMAFMCGGVASAFFWGIVADVFGSRKVLSFTLLVDAALTLAQSSVYDYRLLVVVRCINGFLIGGPSTLVFTYLSDLVGVKKRQFYLNVIGMSFVAAWLVLPALAWLIIPFKLPQNAPSYLPIYSWRLFLALSSLPGFVSGIWVLFLPESPRLLADTNRADKAIKVLAKIYESNVRKSNKDFKIKTLSDLIATKTLTADENRTKELFVGVLRDLKMLVSKIYAWKSTLILFVFFANMAAGFGLNLWIPELLLRMQRVDCKFSQNLIPIKDMRIANDHNDTAVFHDDLTSKEYKQIYDHHKETDSIVDQINATGHIGHHFVRRSEKENCDGDINDEVYTSGLIVGVCCVLGNAACAALSARGGARGVRAAASACAGACAAAAAGLAASACACAASGKAAVAAAAALNAASLNGNVLLIRLLLHALPPRLRGLGVCWGAWWGRAGGVASNLAVGALLDLSCPAPFISVAALLALSVVGIMLIKLEETESLEIEKGVEDVVVQEEGDKYLTLDRYISTHM